MTFDRRRGGGGDNDDGEVVYSRKMDGRCERHGGEDERHGEDCDSSGARSDSSVGHSRVDEQRDGPLCLCCRRLRYRCYRAPPIIVLSIRINVVPYRGIDGVVS